MDVSAITELGANGLLAVTLYWLMTRLVTQIDINASNNVKQHEAMIQSIDTLTKTIEFNTQLMVLHDTTVRGINSDVIGTTEEMVSKALHRINGKKDD